jgi:hypothetical protein
MRAALIALAVLLAAPAAAQGAAFNLGNPDRRLWTRGEAGVFGDASNSMVSRSHLCPAGTRVMAREVDGPARRSSPADLRTIATRSLPERLTREGARAPVRVTTSTIGGWPATRALLDTTNGRIAAAFVFMDGRTIELTAVSADPAFAPRAVDAVITASRFTRP